MDDIAVMLAKYRQGAIGTGDRDPKAANKSHDAMHGYFKCLRESEAGRRGITELITDASPHVRCWAAAHSLSWAPDVARAALEALRDNGGPCSFDAGMVLKEFDNGRLTFEY